jgi:hypothetical protein
MSKFFVLVIAEVHFFDLFANYGNIGVYFIFGNIHQSLYTFGVIG